MTDLADRPAARPKKLTSRRAREDARRTRDWQWEIADRVNRLGILWCCWWNKNRHFNERNPAPADTLVCGLIDGCELLEWFGQHPDWWSIGEWSDERYAAPVSLTDAGRRALADRERYDMDPVTGGLVEPGWQAIPLPKSKEPPR